MHYSWLLHTYVSRTNLVGLARDFDVVPRVVVESDVLGPNLRVQLARAELNGQVDGAVSQRKVQQIVFVA